MKYIMILPLLWLFSCDTLMPPKLEPPKWIQGSWGKDGRVWKFEKDNLIKTHANGHITDYRKDMTRKYVEETENTDSLYIISMPDSDAEHVFIKDNGNQILFEFRMTNTTIENEVLKKL